MLVRVLRMCFHGGRRRYPGDVFDMDTKTMKVGKDNKPLLPVYVESADKPIKASAAETTAKGSAQDKKGESVI
jgi:hypothetical protein